MRAKGGIINNVTGDTLKNDALEGVLDGALKDVLADALIMLFLTAFFSLVLMVYRTSLDLSLIHNVERPI